MFWFLTVHVSGNPSLFRGSYLYVDMLGQTVDCATALAPFSTNGVNLTIKVNLNKPCFGTACAVKKKRKKLAVIC